MKPIIIPLLFSAILFLCFLESCEPDSSVLSPNQKDTTDISKDTTDVSKDTTDIEPPESELTMFLNSIKDSLIHLKLEGIVGNYLSYEEENHTLPKDTSWNTTKTFLDTFEFERQTYNYFSYSAYERGKPYHGMPRGHFSMVKGVKFDTITFQRQTVVERFSSVSSGDYSKSAINEVISMAFNSEKDMITYCSVKKETYSEHSYMGIENGSGYSKSKKLLIFKNIPISIKDSTISFHILASNFYNHFESFSSTYERKSNYSKINGSAFNTYETSDYLPEKGLHFVKDTVLSVNINP